MYSTPRSLSIRALLCAVVALGSLTPSSRGEFIITIRPDGAGNVDASGVGSLNIAALSFVSFEDGPAITSSGSAYATLGSGPTPFAMDTYSVINGPTSFGSSLGFSDATSGSGPYAGLDGSAGYLFVPPGYPSGTRITDSATWNNTTISGLGLTPGTYTYTWGSGTTADSLEVVISSPATATPEPSTLTLLGIGSLSLLGYGWRRRRRNT